MTHWVFNRATSRLKGFDVSSHQLLIDVEAHNETVGTIEYGHDYFGHFGACPPGLYQLAAPEVNDPPVVSMAGWFIPLVDVNHLWRELGRSEIGVHGGGTGSPAPLDSEWQGAWIPTEGCFRVRNGDLTKIVAIARAGDPFEVA